LVSLYLVLLKNIKRVAKIQTIGWIIYIEGGKVKKISPQVVLFRLAGKIQVVHIPSRGAKLNVRASTARIDQNIV